MPCGPDKTEIKFYVEKKIVAEIDSLAKIAGLSRSKMTGNLIYMALEDARLLKKLGVLHAVAKAREFKEKFESGFFEKEEVLN